MIPQSLVYIVDDDPGIQEVISRLVKVIGLEAETFSTGKAFLSQCSPEQRGCIVLDIWLPDITGLELHEELVQRGIRLPVIIISGHGDIPMTVQSIKRGAIDFIEKPFRNSVMLTRIKEAIEMDRRRAEKQAVWGELRIRFATLTRRETEIADLLADGKQNKEIAATLDISPRTVESHRASIMSKLNVRTISALTRVVLEFRGS